MGCTRLGSLLATSPAWVSHMQQTSLEVKSGWQMGVSIPCRRGSPMTITHRSFLVRLVITLGIDWTGSVHTSVYPDMTGPSSVFPRAVNWFCKGISGSGGSLFLLMVLAITSFIFLFWALFPPVYSCEGSFWLWLWCRLHMEPPNSSGSLMLCSQILTSDSSLATCCRRPSIWAQLQQTGLCACHRRKI